VINRRLNAPPFSLLQSSALKQKAKMGCCLLDRFNHIKLVPYVAILVSVPNIASRVLFVAGLPTLTAMRLKTLQALVLLSESQRVL
jgi:hypothetical protein